MWLVLTILGLMIVVAVMWAVWIEKDRVPGDEADRERGELPYDYYKGGK